MISLLELSDYYGKEKLRAAAGSCRDSSLSPESTVDSETQNQNATWRFSHRVRLFPEKSCAGNDEHTVVCNAICACIKTVPEEMHSVKCQLALPPYRSSAFAHISAKDDLVVK